MKKVFENFKKMSLLTKIAAIMLIVSFFLLCSAFLGGFIVDIFSGYFVMMFSNFSNVMHNSYMYLVELLGIATLGLLVVAVFSGSKKNVGVVLMIKALIISIELLVVTPYLFMIDRIVFGYANVLRNFMDEISYYVYDFIHTIDIFAALVAMAVLLFGGFGKRTKLFGFIIAGVFAVFATEMLIGSIIDVIDMVKEFSSGEITSAMYSLFYNSPTSMAGMFRFGALALISLGVAFSAKNAPKKIKTDEASNAEQK